jgi:hypothetical protein
VTGVAANARCGVMALFPIGNDVWSLLAVATDALVAVVRSMNFLKRN